MGAGQSNPTPPKISVDDWLGGTGSWLEGTNPWTGRFSAKLTLCGDVLLWINIKLVTEYHNNHNWSLTVARKLRSKQNKLKLIGWGGLGGNQPFSVSEIPGAHYFAIILQVSQNNHYFCVGLISLMITKSRSVRPRYFSIPSANFSDHNLGHISESGRFSWFLTHLPTFRSINSEGV